MSSEWKRDVIIQIISGTISGILSGLIIVFAQKSLERRIKKLEEEERRKNEQERYSGLSKTLITFKKMHVDNSKLSSEFSGWHEITPGGEKKEEHNVAFKIVRKLLNRLLIKISKNDKEDCFVVVCDHKGNNRSYQYLSWGKYKEVVGKSKNYFKYFENLKKDSNNADRCCNVMFSEEQISSFCSKINAEIL